MKKTEIVEDSYSIILVKKKWKNIIYLCIKYKIIYLLYI